MRKDLARAGRKSSLLTRRNPRGRLSSATMSWSKGKKEIKEEKKLLDGDADLLVALVDASMSHSEPQYLVVYSAPYVLSCLPCKFQGVVPL